MGYRLGLSGVLDFFHQGFALVNFFEAFEDTEGVDVNAATQFFLELVVP